MLQLAISGCCNDSPPVLTPPPIWQVGSVIPPDGLTETALSPDGKQFVYSDQTQDIVGSHIFIADVGGKNRRQLTDLPTGDGTPSWSPDGKKIIFTRAARHRCYSMGGMVWDCWDIWTVSLDGHQEQRLTSEKFYQASEPNFSSDMRQVLFWAYREPSGNAPSGQPGSDEIVIGDLNENGAMTAMRWMPTTPGPDGRSFFPAENRDASFSPDGRTIVFVSNRVGRVAPFDYEVWLTDPAFSRMVQLTHLHSRLSSPTFTRDGQSILFGCWGANSLWQIKPDGSDLKQIR